MGLYTGVGYAGAVASLGEFHGSGAMTTVD
jgi:hypothetical protein